MARGSLRTRLREHGQHPDAPRKPPGRSGLTFRLELAKLVRAGRKTETRRLVKPGETAYRLHPGDDVAVQPGRGKRALCRVQITDVFSEPLGQLRDEDARAEGFEDRAAFFAYWRDLHGLSLPAPQLAVLERLAVSDPVPAAALWPTTAPQALTARLHALRRRGYAHRDPDGLWSITDAGADYLDDPATAVDLDQPVWVVRFRLADEGRDRPKLMTASGVGDWEGEGLPYTGSPSGAAGGVPVTLPDGREVYAPEPETIDYKRTEARAVRSERDHTEALIDDLEARLADARARAKAKGLDIANHERAIHERIDRLERLIEREAA